MGGILNTLATVANSMAATQKALDVTVNNVSNANTPGFARRQMNFVAGRFLPETGLVGGVEVGETLNTRDQYLEQGVRLQSQRFGYSTQLRSSLEQLEPVLDISAGTGISEAMTGLFNSFANWSVTPNDTGARQNVIERASEVAQNFQFTIHAMSAVDNNSRGELRGTVSSINKLAERIRAVNEEFRKDRRTLADSGLDAQVHAALEELSELVDFTALRQEDGSFSIFLGGQVPLVIGDQAYSVMADFSSAEVQVLDWEGNSFNGRIELGRLRALLDLSNSTLPGLMGQLNNLAEALASRVNAILAGGVDVNGQAPARDLFSYDAAVGAAHTLSVTAIGPEELAAALPEAPGGNSNALNLADLVRTQEVEGLTFTQYFGQIAGGLGRRLAQAGESEHSYSLLLSQARQMRADTSGVSLDQQAVELIEYQRAYQASGQMIRVLQELTDTLMGMVA